MALPACSAAPATPVGVSSFEAEPAAAPAKARPALATWPAFAQAQTWPEVAPPVPALQHYRDGTRIRVRVEPASAEPYRALATESPMPDGARVAAFHETPAGDLRGVYVLEKQNGAWTALSLDARGTALPVDTARCVRCHALAPTDFLFGVIARAPGN